MEPRHSTTKPSLAADTSGGGSDWTTADLIDLEYYLDADERLLRDRPSSRRELTARDRAIYLEQIEPELKGLAPHTPLHRRLSLRSWLRARRRAEDPQIRALLPGLVFARAQRLVLILAALLGFLSGVSLASALLDYDGHLPVSVPWFIFVLVVLQFVLSLGTVMTWLSRLLRRDRPHIEESWLLSQVLHPLLERLAHWLQEQHLSHVAQELRDRALSSQGLIRAHFAVYEPLAILAVFIPLQVFGVAFNIGALSATVLLEWFTDIAFGWGTSLSAHPQTIYDLVRLIAAPWGWLFGEGIGYPTLEQIEGSRVYMEQWALLGRGFDPNPEHLRAWRWFLVLALLTYGFLPRLALLLGSLLVQHLTLKRLSFTHGRLQALYARMLSPHVDTRVGESTSGSEMYIPTEPVERRSALIGPLPPSKPVVGRRPWREPSPEPAEYTPETPVGERAPAPTPEPPPPAPPSEVQPTQRPLPEGLRILSPTPPAGGEQTEVPAGAPEAPAAQPPGALERPEPEITQGQVQTTEDSIATRPESLAPTGPQVQAEGRYAADACLALIHVDIDDLLGPQDRQRLETLLLRLSGWRVAAAAPFGAGSQMNGRAIALIEEGVWESPPPRIAVIQDGSQPPITENLIFLRELRAAAGPKAQILLALVGDPTEDEPLAPLRVFDYRDWQSKIDQMADPYLRLEMLNPPEEEGED